MKERIYPLIPLLVVIVFLYLLSRYVDSNMVREWVESAGIFGPIVIIILGALTTIFAPLSGTPLLFVGFALYGAQVVFLLTIASLISSAVNFYISRRWGRPLIMRFIGKKNMATVDRFTVEHGAISLFFLRVFLNSLNDYISYALGLTSMKFKTYYLVTLIAAIPGVLIWYVIGLNSETPLMFTMFTFIFVGAFSLVFMVAKFAQRFAKKLGTKKL